MTGPAADELTIDRRAARRVALDATSWVDLVEGFVREPAAALGAIESAATWEQTEVLRYDRFVPERRLMAGLRPDCVTLLRQTTMHLTSRYRQSFTGVAAILYRDGDDFQGLHSDREMRWLDDTLIAIVVLGQRRPFVLRPRLERASDVLVRVPAGEQEGDVVLRPGEGDLLVMGGACQRDWLHGVPRASTANPRLSLTWRWTSRRGRPDTNPTYYDGRHYSDGPRQAGSRSRPV